MHARPLVITSTLVLAGMLFAAAPANAVFSLPADDSCEWNSVVVQETSTGKVLQTQQQDGWERTILLNVETGAVISDTASCSLAEKSPVMLANQPEFMNLFGFFSNH